MKFSYNANGLRNVPVDAAIRDVAEAGYAAIELSLHPAHIDPFSFTPTVARRISGALDETAIVACCLATGADTLLSDERFEPSLIHPDHAGRGRRVDLIKRSIDIARTLDIPMINFASGPRRSDVEDRAATDWLSEGLRECLDYADDDVVLAMEPEPGFFLETNDSVAELISSLGSPSLTLAQDLGHCRVVEEDYLGSVSRNLAVTSIIQVEDIKGRVHYHEIPGDGDIDFAGFFDVCRAGGYDGYYSVELYNHSDQHRTALARSLRHLEMQSSAPSAV